MVPAQILKTPGEAMNRQTFAFNQGFDTVISRPLAKGYQFITPKPVRESVTRVFKNTMEPANAVNNVMQGKSRRWNPFFIPFND